MIVTVAVALPPRPSPTVYVKTSVPTKLDAGVYVMVPFTFNATDPCAGEVTLRIVKTSPSGSRSLARGETAVATALNVVRASLTATGGRLALPPSGGPPATVANRVRKDIGADEVRRGRIRDGAVRVQRHGSVRG